jgi:hypothetical protein
MHGAGVRRCSHEGCPHKVIVGGVCVMHGARVLRCRHKGCKNQTVKGGVCRRHNAPKSFCSHKGCKNAIVRGSGGSFPSPFFILAGNSKFQRAKKERKKRRTTD